MGCPRNKVAVSPEGSAFEEDPIAICGFALKFPQEAATEEAFWTMLVEKRSAMTEFPPDRMNINGFYHPSRSQSLRTRGAHFILEDVGAFDADFFSITPSVAAAMDPMQRLLLETAFHAFESAGIPIESIRGSRTSVHTGCFSNDYLQQILKDSERLPPYAAIGASQSMLANRLSWFYDLRGPSVNLDSACSSSAMAVDLACQLLHSGRTDMAVVAGCNLLLDPDFSRILSDMQMLSPDGLCYAFDHRANGYSRGEGIAVVVLKRLSSALQNNDTIRAVIRASGSSQDGRTAGITQPDAQAQLQLIRETYQHAGLSLEHTRFFEAHGTGTEIGDPVEISAIATAFQDHRTPADPLYVGSVKTNIGHLEGASGIAGLIKAILVVESGTIPPNANFESINRRLASYDHVVSFPGKPIEWPSCKIRRASINSFGYGGSNCHIVIDDAYSYLHGKGLAPKALTITRPTMDPSSIISNIQFQDGSYILPTTVSLSSPMSESPKLLVWSAATEAATRRLISDWQKYYNKASRALSTVTLSNIAYTLDSRRSSLRFTAYAVISSAADLENISQHASAPTERPRRNPRVAFLFTGQGAQWHAMGRELFMFPKFANGLDESDAVLAEFGSRWNIRDELLADEQCSRVDRPDIAQTLTTVLQLGLVDLLKSFGVVPVAVVGHSMGEIAAAYCAGFINRKSALRLAYYRGLLTAQMSESDVFTGAMLAVALPAAPLEAYLERVCPGDSAWPDKLVIGCVNSPTNTTVSGNLRYIQLLQEMLDAEGIFNRRLRVPVAYHSPQMAKIVSECCNHFSPLESSVPTSQINMVSTVTGSLLSRETAVQGAYWIENILSPVLFSSAIQSVCRGHDLDSHGPRKKLDRSHHTFLGANLLIEIGPHAALRLPVLETVNEMSSKVAIRYFSALHRKQPASTSLLRLLGELQSLGMAVNLRKANQPYLPHEEVPMSLVDAPKYPFDHANKYWSESHVIRNYRQRNHGYVELLGTPIKEWNPLEPQWRCCVDIADMPWLLEHQLNGRAVYPASAFLVMAIQGACQLVKTGTEIVAFTLCDVRFESAIPVSIDERELETRLRFRKPRSGSSRTETCWEFSVFSVTAGNWNESCVGTIQLHHQPGIPSEGLEEQPGTLCDLFETRSRASHYYYHKTEVYGNFAKHGFLYGSVFQGIDEIRHDGQDSAIGRLSRSIPSGSGDIKDYSVIHPATLDSFLQTALTALSRGDRTIPTQAVSSIKRIWISAEGLQPGSGHIWTSARLESQKLMNKVYSAFGLCEDQKHVRIELDELETTVVSLPEEDTLPLALYSQHLYEFHTCVDIAVLSGAEVVDLLKSVCGPDTLGPGIFYHNLRQFLHKRTQKILQELSTDDLDKTKPYLKRYWEWLHWQTSQHESLISEASNSLLRTCLESQGFLGEFFLRFSDVVLEVLRGRCDIVGLLFEDNLVASFYEQQLSGSLFYRKLQVYLDFYSFKNPGLEVLEIGAGTGSFTEHILDAFSSSAIRPEARCKSYMYTDVSPAFFEKAREKFDKYTHQMAFAVLDIEQDPVSQGFVERGFDVVSASNVLHVTKDLDTTLQNIRRLLKKGGKLILHEYIVPEDIEVGFVFGLLPGWWPSSEEARKMSPLCTERSWDELLRKNGFSGAEIIIPDFCDSESHRMSIMIATATDAGSDPHLLDVTFVVESHSTTQLELANCLASLFSADGFRPTNILDISDTVSCPATTGLIVTLFDWETPLLSRMNEGIFETLKSLLASTRSILWVSGGGQATSLPDHGLVDGFARVYRQENISARFATLRLDGNTTEEQEKWIVCAAKELLKASEPAHPEDYIMEDGMLCLRRICESPQLMQKLLDTNSGIAQIAGTGGSADTLPICQAGTASPLFDPDSSYLISGGLGDLGICIADWMVRSGARNLILLSRSGPRTQKAIQFVRNVESLGGQARTPRCDIADFESLWSALVTCGDMPAIRGCIQAAGVLKDLLFENMTFRDWEIVISPKVHGSWNLHALLPSGMDFFIMASSISGVVGQPTQANYAAANTYQDALARYRLAQGEKAISLDLGMLLTGGLLSQSSVERLSADGTYVPLSESEILAHFEYFCNRNLSIQDIPTQVVSGIVSPSVQCRKPNTSSLPFSHPLWQLELCTSTTSRKLEEDHDKTIDRRTLANAESHTEMSEIVSNALADKFCSLSLNTRAKVSLDEPLHSLGADSLTAVYLRNWVTKEFGVSIAIFDLLGDMSIAALGSFIAKEWRTSQGK